MSTPQEQLAALDALIATGVSSAEFMSGDRKEKQEFRSMSEMLQARDILSAQIAAQSAPAPGRSIITQFTRD